eukprot:1160044-Pelagomonas_calceolata.AAC.2
MYCHAGPEGLTFEEVQTAVGQHLAEAGFVHGYMGYWAAREILLSSHLQRESAPVCGFVCIGLPVCGDAACALVSVWVGVCWDWDACAMARLPVCWFGIAVSACLCVGVACVPVCVCVPVCLCIMVGECGMEVGALAWILLRAVSGRFRVRA